MVSETFDRTRVFSDIKRVVTKIGSRTLQGWDGRLDEVQFHHLARELSSLYQKGIEVVHITSGAVKTGIQDLGIDETALNGLSESEKNSKQQAYAAHGQPILMSRYYEYFNMFNQKASQMLFLSDVLEDPDRLADFLRCYEEHRREGIIPIGNNNDTFSTAELGYSENDRLQADIAIALTRADGVRTLGLILSEHQLYDRNPDIEGAVPYGLIRFPIPDSIRENAGTGPGSGGMYAKLEAAERMLENDIPVVIVEGRYGPEQRDIVIPIMEGRPLGTLFLPSGY